jgi:soluble lytic murein transglycosylase-like protein
MESTQGPRIRTSPGKQVLHSTSPLRIVIKDPAGDLENFSFVVRYNGLDVSRSFTQRSRFRTRWDRKLLVVENPAVKLSATDQHQIEFIYRNSAGQLARAKFEPPSCNAFELKPVRTTGDFNPSGKLLGTIARHSRDQKLSPAFFTALVAQESGFDPTSVSWAKAMGLTQVTSLAETEILKKFKDWPRYPGLDEMSSAQVKLLILRGTINAKNEWRLDDEKSIQGGIAYLKLLNERWNSPENLAKIQSISQATSEDPVIAQTQLILASYNSGYSRVKQAVDTLGKDWMKSAELGEARKYVNRIFSYCNHFSEREDWDETET